MKLRWKKPKRPIAVLTCYDAPTAALLERCGTDILLVGDSVATVLLGYSATTEVTLDEMLHHARAVRRGAPRSFIVGDMPLKGLAGGLAGALRSARRFLEEGGCDAVKIEWSPRAPAITRKLVSRGIPVMGHTGLTPQRARALGGLKLQGKTAQSARNIVRASRAFEEAGAFSLVLECVPAELASFITRALRIPTIGIGAGPACDGQVLVFQDLVGLTPQFKARFVRRYARVHETEEKAVRRFLADVRGRRFPARRESFNMDRQDGGR